MDFNSSEQELQADDELVTRKFYDKFVERDPQIRDMFRDVDLDQQAVMLTTALTSVKLSYLRKIPAVTQFLTELGRKHVDLGVPRELYPAFGECLLETLAEYHGPNWSDDLQREWQAAIEQAIQVMLAAYGDTEETG